MEAVDAARGVLWVAALVLLNKSLPYGTVLWLLYGLDTLSAGLTLGIPALLETTDPCMPRFWCEIVVDDG